MSLLTENSITSYLHTRTRLKMQRHESFEIMMRIGDVRQQCCSSHDGSFSPNICAFTMGQIHFQAQGHRHGSEQKNKQHRVPSPQGKKSILGELTIS